MTEIADGAGLDQIHIRRLQCRCIIGINDDERRDKQDVVVTVTLYADLRKAGRTDAIEDTVDYKTIKKEILRLAEGSNFYLIEALAENIAQLCLTRDRVRRVRVIVEKPSALRFARTVAVEIVRDKQEVGR